MRKVYMHRMITIHNNPENQTPPKRIKHLKLEVPDVVTADIRKYFDSVY